jgi:hypothetical protein
MTQHILNTITPWTTEDLITLSELKLQLRIADTDTSKDAELALIIDGISAQMATFANRVFGFANVDETFYQIGDESRLYFSRWPVKSTDITKLTYNGADILPALGTDWVLEQKTGTIYRPADMWNGTLDAVYSGGYKLPDEAPDDLQRAAFAAAREDYYIYVRGAVLSGVRMISHKHARVQYYPPGQVGATVSGALGPAGSSATWNAVMAVLNHYIRFWV